MNWNNVTYKHFCGRWGNNPGERRVKMYIERSASPLRKPVKTNRSEKLIMQYYE